MASGKPATMAMTPDENAVARQPKVCSDHATTGSEIPPSASPIDMDESARARQRSNQWISAVLIGNMPQKLAPSAMTTNAA